MSRRTYITIADAAERGHCSQRSIRRRVSEGALTAYRMGPRLIRIDADELDNLFTPIPTAGTSR